MESSLPDTIPSTYAVVAYAPIALTGWYAESAELSALEESELNALSVYADATDEAIEETEALSSPPAIAEPLMPVTWPMLLLPTAL